MPLPKDQLKVYYEKFFPAELMAEWLSYGNPATLAKREFSLTLQNAEGQDIFARFRRYNSADEIRDAFVKQLPIKADVGAIYNAPPDMKLTTKLIPMERELVFDIDMSDYDEIRSCCKGKKICRDCWPWMACAVKAIHEIVKKDFGYSNFLNVFSGRRGVHCWVCDKAARLLSDEERAALVGYMTVHQGAAGKGGINVGFDLLRQGIQAVHPTMEAVCRNVLAPAFENIFGNRDNQNFVENPAAAKVVIGAIMEIANAHKQPDMDKYIEKYIAGIEDGEGLSIDAVMRMPERARFALYFKLLYPRLDEKVSTSRNHLLKIPYVIHPGSGRLCVPLFLDSIEEFDPVNDPPTLDSMVGEMQGFEPRWKQPMIALNEDLKKDQ